MSYHSITCECEIDKCFCLTYPESHAPSNADELARNIQKMLSKQNQALPHFCAEVSVVSVAPQPEDACTSISFKATINYDQDCEYEVEPDPSPYDENVYIGGGIETLEYPDIESDTDQMIHAALSGLDLKNLLDFDIYDSVNRSMSEDDLYNMAVDDYIDRDDW